MNIPAPQEHSMDHLAYAELENTEQYDGAVASDIALAAARRQAEAEAAAHRLRVEAEQKQAALERQAAIEATNRAMGSFVALSVNLADTYNTNNPALFWSETHGPLKLTINNATTDAGRSSRRLEEVRVLVRDQAGMTLYDLGVHRQPGETEYHAQIGSHYKLEGLPPQTGHFWYNAPSGRADFWPAEVMDYMPQFFTVSNMLSQLAAPVETPAAG